jgi:hypothetical protein
MRGKRSEIPVEVVVHKRRGRPPRGFMPPVAAPVIEAGTQANEGEESQAPTLQRKQRAQSPHDSTVAMSAPFLSQQIWDAVLAATNGRGPFLSA